MMDSTEYRRRLIWEDYQHEWFWYKMRKTSEAIGYHGSYNNPCITCSFSNCAFCPIVRHGADG